MIIEEEGVREAQAEGSIYIHGSERGSLIRSSLDARIIPMDPTLSEWLQKILFTISSKQASKRTLTGLAEAFAEHNIDPAVAEKESGRFFRELSSLGSIQVCGRGRHE